MNNPLQVGITGGIGAGKTVVTKIFSCLGAPCYDSDQRAKALMSENPQLKTAIIDKFGPRSYHPDGKLNRGFLADMVFGDSEKTNSLNQIVHPRVAEDYQQWLESQSIAPYVIKEAALLIETGIYRSLDYLVVVMAPESLRLERVLERDPHRQRKQVLDIMAKQVNDEVRRRVANFEIHNDGEAMVIPQVLELHRRFVNPEGLPVR